MTRGDRNVAVLLTLLIQSEMVMSKHCTPGIIDPDDNTGPDAAVGALQYDGHEGQHFTFEHRYDGQYWAFQHGNK